VFFYWRDKYHGNKFIGAGEFFVLLSGCLINIYDYFFCNNIVIFISGLMNK